jgi:hypothetical protein
LPFDPKREICQRSPQHQITFTHFDSLVSYFHEHHYPLKCFSTHTQGGAVPKAAITPGHSTGFISWPNKESWWQMDLGRRVLLRSYTMWRPQEEPNIWYFETCDGDPTVGPWEHPDKDGTNDRGLRENYRFPSGKVTFPLREPVFAQHVMIYHYAPLGSQVEGNRAEILRIPQIDFSGSIQGDGTYIPIDHLP